MIIIGENINILNSRVYNGIMSQNYYTIVELAMLQIKAGAEVLDIHLGPDISRSSDIMQTIVKTIQEEVPVPLFLNGSEEMLEAGLSVHKGKAIINGITGEKDRTYNLLFLARKYKAQIVVMTLPGNGFTREIDDKCQIAMDIIDDARTCGIGASDIFLDPVVTSYSLNPAAVSEAVQCIKHFKEFFPDVKTVMGLSNISQGIKKENSSLINSTVLGMMVGAGLDAVILNPFDKRVIDTAKTAKLLCTQGIYCDSYLAARPAIAANIELKYFPYDLVMNPQLLWEIK